ncbi:MAG: hypothetical protein ACREHD_25150 [Pirellulales bacterium]
MIVANQALPDAFFESLGLLKRLHLLSLAENDQGDEADVIREAMERLWWRLSDVERDRLDGLSADLYSIGENRPAPARVGDDVTKSFEAAISSGKWDDALEVLRQHEAALPPSDVAALRGVAWGSLGHHNIAALFFAEAVRLRPDDINPKCLYLRALVRAGERERAKEEATRLADAANNSCDLLLAADVLFDCEQPESAEPNVETLRRIAALAERALIAWKAEPIGEALSRVACAGFLSGAISSEWIGEHARSDKLYAMAQTLLPRAVPLVSPGSQRKGSNFVTTLLQAKHQVEAQLLSAN